MATFEHDGLTFHYGDVGRGVPFVFQHGLGADIEQPLGIFTPPEGIRLIAFDCRYHGLTNPNGPPDKLRIRTFADDLAVFLDHLEISQSVVGGISMGAAVAMSFALRFTSRVLGLVLSRPAWLVGPNHEIANRFSFVAKLLRSFGPVRGKEEMIKSTVYCELASESPDAAESLCNQFDKPQAVERSDRLDRITRDSVLDSLSQLIEITVPTLVLSNRHDPIHPFAYGESIANAIPGARFCGITAKSVSREAHAADVQRFLTNYLQEHFL